MRIPPGTRSPGAARSRGDDIARTFREELLDAFREPVFTRSAVAPAEEIYVSRRAWMLGGRPPCEPLAYEHYFHQQLQSHSPSVILLVAGAGVGKSTFLQYFFQFFEPRPAGIPLSPPREQFLLLECDIRQPQPEDAAKARAYEAWFHRLNADFTSRHGVDIREWDDFAIYDDLSNWTPLATSRESRESRVQRRMAASSRRFDHRELLRSAIRLRMRAEPDKRRRIVFLPDNLDQHDPACQHSLVSDLINLVDEFGPKETLLVLPLRPESRARLALRHFPLPQRRALEVELGPCEETTLIGTRMGCLRRHVGLSHRIVDIDMVDEFGDRAFTPMRAGDAADILADAIRWGLDDTLTSEADSALRVLGKIVSGSARRSKDLRLRVAFSGVAKQKRLMRQRPHLSPYAFLDAYLSGEQGMLVPGSVGCSLVNLFHTTRSGPHRNDAPYASIVGVHLLYLLRSGRLRTAQIHGPLSKLGYPRQFVEESLAKFQEYGVLHLVGPENSADQEIMVEVELVEAHYRLLEQPAYVDHVAMTTPVDPRRAESMRITSGSDPDDFLARIETAIQFLHQIREDELRVFGMDPANPPPHGTREDLRVRLEPLRFQASWAIMAYHYRVRLEFILRHDKLPPEVDETRFRALAESEIFHVSAERTIRPFDRW